MPDSRFGKAYDLYKKTLYEFISNAFKWDETFQINRFQNKYQKEWFHDLRINNKIIGYLCFYKTSFELHVSLLIIESEYRSHGYGKVIMNQLKSDAIKEGLNMSLSSFKENKSAIKFYTKLGFKIVKEDNIFIDMKLELN